MRLRTLLLALVAAPGIQPTFADEKDDLAREARRILTAHCYRCHGQNGANEGGFSKVLDFPAAGGKVVPGDPARSRLFTRVSKGTMPPEEVDRRPTDAEVAALEKWIKAGAPAPPADGGAPRTTVTLRDELAAIRDYLKSPQVDEEDQKYIRFFTLRHLHNLPAGRVRDADLRVYRAAVSKLVNSLSRKKEVVVPVPVDKAETVLAVDLRKLDWDRKGLWAEVLREYPYGLKHDQNPNDRVTRRLAAEVYALAGTEVPAVRADWFIAAASRPPLYHTLLQLPTTATELERDLKVPVADHVRDGKKAQRAGFNGSGVSGSNRLVERHDSEHGAYWKSYDFKSSAGRGNLFVFPLGPEFKGNPFNRNAFRHDGGEIIFSLPNGFQGYLLVDGKDQRIDEGPIQVVSDRTRTTTTPLVINGLSCMACHQHGMIPFKDQVRAGHILGGQARDRVERLYPEAAEMEKLVDQDRKRFLAALEAATGPFLKVGDDAARPITDAAFPEPISAIARWYLVQELTAEDAAGELGLTDPAALRQAVRDPYLQELGLYPLGKGNPIKREVWEDRSGLLSPFQEAARVLEMGTPVVPNKSARSGSPE